MPFTKKYSYSGNTKIIRIPEKDILFVTNILNDLNRIRSIKGDDFVNKIKEKIEDGLKSIE